MANILDHSVEIRIPTQCGDCKKSLPEQVRSPLLVEAKRDFGNWFGGFEVTHKQGGYVFPDGTLAEEEVDVVASNCSGKALEEHFEDLTIFAVRVANELSQDSVALSIDGRMRFYDRTAGTGKCLHAKKGAAPSIPLVVPAGRKPKTVSEKLQALYTALDSFPNLNAAKYVFGELLSYDLIDEALPWRDWPKDLRERLSVAPQVFAHAKDFKIVYLHQTGDQLSRGTTRAVIARIMRDNANLFYGLFVVSNKTGNKWALVNARIVDGKANRLNLRRIPVGTGLGARTATERLALVDLDGREKLTAQQIQDLHDSAFDVEGVSKEFYLKIAAWYFWAQQHPDVEYPRSVKTDADKSIFFIRLLTRLIFCWFMRAKGLIPTMLFNQNFIKENIKDTDPDSGTYYKAILQNLFFATLNRAIDERSFRRKNDKGLDGNYGVTTLYRYADLMRDPKVILVEFKKVPFVNGGLFECLDDTLKKPEVRLDDFSENGKNKLCIPNELFFGRERELDLSKIYDDEKHKKDHVAGLINILDQYQFTVEENTPLDQAVALDPELLGKVFENLLASYNEETKTTARKALGAFYTPREIVEHMVDESLLAYFKSKMSDTSNEMDAKLRKLLSYNDEPHGLSDKEVETLIAAIDNLKALDPAVGSGAFPMGMLLKLVHMLGKLDPGNEQWKTRQLDKIEDVGLREEAERAFQDNPADYGRKLYLIENCLYGVDIQPIAVQIAKMRFFISLIVDQSATEDAGKNYGILALPNLETKFVAANTLISIEKPKTGEFLGSLFDSIDAVKELDRKLKDLRHRLFSAKTPATKRKLRDEDQRLREQMGDILKASAGWSNDSARKFASWDPYNQNASSPWYDPESMFGIEDGFDVVIGNPPYIFTRDADFSIDFKNHITTNYFSLLTSKDKKSKANQSGKINLFALFILRGLFDCKTKGVLSFIVPNNLLRTTTYDLVRKYILDNAKIEELVDLGSGVFDNVTASTIIIRLRNEKNNSNHNIKIITEIKNIERQEFKKTTIEQNQFLKNVSYTFNIFANDSTNTLLTKISDGKEDLGKFCIDIIEGIVAHKHLISETESKNAQPLLEGKTIKRFGLNRVNKFINWSVKEIHRTRPDYLWKAPKKIIIQRISGGSNPLTATIDVKKHKTFASINNLLLKSEYENDYEFILALINSRVLNWYYANSFSNNSELTVNISKTFLEKLPIPKVSKQMHNLITTIVSKILSVKEKNHDADTSKLEKQLDELVYKLYELTAEEMNIIGDVK